MLEITEVKGGPFADRAQALAQNGGVLPLGTRLAKERPRPGQAGESWWLLGRNAVVTGRDLRNARPSQDEFGKWETSFTLSQDASKRFGRFTESNIGNKLSVVLDNQIFSVATIQSKIEDQGRITGAGDQQEASDLALVLRAGSLPASVTYLEERTVGPSLGADSPTASDRRSSLSATGSCGGSGPRCTMLASALGIAPVPLPLGPAEFGFDDYFKFAGSGAYWKSQGKKGESVEVNAPGGAKAYEITKIEWK